MAAASVVEGAAVGYALSLGYSLKKEQLDVIVKYAMGRDVFAVLPTGYGKSLCYQCLPYVFNKLFFDGREHSSIIIVISPLIAIMKDQVNMKYCSMHVSSIASDYLGGEVQFSRHVDSSCYWRIL